MTKISPETRLQMEPPWQKDRVWQNPITSIESDATLKMDPHPGNIGGCVAGTVKLPRNTKITAGCVLRLSCISNVPTGRDDNSDDGSEVLWFEEINATPRTTHDGVEIDFTFDEVPDNLPESQLPLAGYHIDWQLALTAPTDEAELRHTFLLPVFETEFYEDEPAKAAAEIKSLLATWRLESTWQPYRAEITTEEDSLVIRHGPWRGGMYQTGGWKGLVAILLCFFASMALLVFANDELVSTVVTGVFGSVGLIVTSLAGYLWIRTVDIRVRPGRLTLRSHIFDRTVRLRTLQSKEISDITIRLGQLYVVSDKYGELSLIDSVHDLRLLNALRRLIVVYL